MSFLFVLVYKHDDAYFMGEMQKCMKPVERGGAWRDNDAQTNPPPLMTVVSQPRQKTSGVPLLHFLLVGGDDDFFFCHAQRLGYMTPVRAAGMPDEPFERERVEVFKPFQIHDKQALLLSVLEESTTGG